MDSKPELPVLVMSGYPTPDTISESLSKGARDFIEKPFTPEELIEAVQSALDTPERVIKME